MNNQCFINVDIDGYNDLWSVTKPIAKKEHSCCECHDVIPIGDKYERVFLVSEGVAYTYKTCQPCTEIRDAFFCSYYYELLWEGLWDEEIEYDGIPMCSFNGFSKEAIAKLSEFFDRVNEQERYDEDED